MVLYKLKHVCNAGVHSTGQSPTCLWVSPMACWRSYHLTNVLAAVLQSSFQLIEPLRPLAGSTTATFGWKT